MSESANPAGHIAESSNSNENNSPHGVEGGVPRVSVGVPVYNGESFLQEALDSLLSQTFRDFELIISDNASTDRTEEICRAYASRDSRIRYYRADVNRGAAWNHNRVFELGRGEYFKWAPADDLCGPEFLARCVAELDQDPAAVMASPNVVEIDQYGKRLEAATVPGAPLTPLESPSAAAHVRFRQRIRLDHLCLTIYSLFRSQILRRTNLIGNYSDSDRVLLAHLALYGHSITIPEVLFFNRDHPDRFTRTYIGWRDRMVWFDASNANRKTFPFWREFIELWRVIPRSPLRWQQRLCCYWALVGWARDNMNLLFYNDLSYYPKKWVGRRFPKVKAAWNSLQARWAAKNTGLRNGSTERSESAKPSS